MNRFHKIAIFLFAICLLYSCSQKSDTIKIGAILPMTGEAAKYGVWAKNGMDMAIDEINKTQNGKKLVLEIQDSKTSPTEAVNAVNYMLSISKPVAIFTTLTSVCKALIPITEKEKVILFANSTLPGITDNSQYVFRNVANLSSDIQAAVDYCLNKLDNNPVGIIWRNDDFGVWASNKFRQLYENKSGKITSSVSFDPKTTDFRSYILKLAQRNPDIIYILAYSESGIIIKQAKELGYNWQFMGITTLGDPEVARIAGEALNSAIFTESAFDPNADQQKIKIYQAEYQKRYDEISEVWAATFYDAVKILYLSVQKAGTDPDKLKEALLNISEYPGISGNTTFLTNGDVIKPVNMKTIINGKPVPIED